MKQRNVVALAGVASTVAALAILLIAPARPANSACCSAPVDKKQEGSQFGCGWRQYDLYYRQCGFDDDTWAGTADVGGYCAGGYEDCACQWVPQYTMYGVIDYVVMSFGTNWELYWEVRYADGSFQNCGSSDSCPGNYSEITFYGPERWEGHEFVAKECY